MLDSFGDGLLAAHCAVGQSPRREPDPVRIVVAAAGTGMANRKKGGHNNRKKSSTQKPVAKTPPQQPFHLRAFLKSLGPGLITGASDDDPSGIGTYSQA